MEGATRGAPVNPGRGNGLDGCPNPCTGVGGAARKRLPTTCQPEDGPAAVQHLVSTGCVTLKQLPSRGSLRRLQAHECHQHETKLGGPETEQNVKRLKKPEGVAESGGGRPDELARRLR